MTWLVVFFVVGVFVGAVIFEKPEWVRAAWAWVKSLF